MDLQGKGRERRAADSAVRVEVLVNIGISSGLFCALIHPIIVYTEVPAYLAGNVAKIISVTVASTISFFIKRYVVISRRRWFNDRL